MARGFESKDVEFQQAEAEAARRPGTALTETERDRRAARRTIELALANARHDLARAAVPAHRKMLEQTIEALEEALGRDNRDAGLQRLRTP
jgi:hypothetical protein